MVWLRVVNGLISVFFLIIVLIQTSLFKKEFKEEINDDRSVSENFIKRWDQRSKKGIILGIIAMVFGLIATFSSY
ncbi:hypothetical protein SRABI96_00093 [Peribacillus sp. Bi96]|nr:hypothetical protein SRABI96_00093 [Peribacillus sp. Bi96]